jgi:hypothetical protein
VPEAEGGLGLGDIDWALMTQELGYYAIPDSLADTAYVAAVCWRAACRPRAAREWLPTVADGSARIAVGHPVNPLGGRRAHGRPVLLSRQATRARWHCTRYRQARCLAPLPSIDASRRLSNVDWTPMPHSCVPKARRRTAGCGTQRWTAGPSMPQDSWSGLAQRMLDLSVDYVAQRKQFGKPIGSFQAVKHHLADVATKIEFAKPVLYRAALALAQGDPHRAAMVSHAKLACADAAWTAGRKGIQVHGAMGYTWEVDLQMFMKRAWVLDAAWGDRAFHKARLAETLLADGAPLGTGRHLCKAATHHG